MDRLLLNPDNLQISFGGKTITLLPKEFGLLQFLFEHPNQGFSRSALLDAVWPLEAPVDRTVDDHIYRLRKKLKCWENIFLIETVRSIGYRLRFLDQKRLDLPSKDDEAFNHQFNQIISKYHSFGQGESMQVLADQQTILGANLNPFYTMYMKIINGEWQVLLDESIPFWNRAYFMIVLFTLLEDDPLIGCNLIEKILENNELETARKWELESLDLVFCLLWSGQIEKASNRIEWALEMVSQHQLVGYHLAVSLNSVYVLMSESLSKAAAKLTEIDSLLKNKPFLRERSYFEIAKGIYHLKNNELEEGQNSIQLGIEIMKSTKFELQYLHSITHVFHLLEQHVTKDHKLLTYYKNLRKDLIKHFNGEEWKVLIKQQFISYF